MVIKMAEHKGYIRSADERGSVNISRSVVSVIAATATVEVDGVYGLYQSASRELTKVSSKKGLSKGIKIHSNEDGSIVVDVHFIAKLGLAVNEVGEEVQKAVKAAIEEAVGVNVSAVNVNICGISLKKARPQEAPEQTEKAK
ncbi:MAG: Asp23/Gls24 family envelope stress response protein [Oscillospiraceae bacterium]|nr:Asp23/Gls24 family envelope stress response protein [Oscillospiraceae bacterium]